jgi:hypothetical protein
MVRFFDNFILVLIFLYRLILLFRNSFIWVAYHGRGGMILWGMGISRLLASKECKLLQIGRMSS